MCEPVFCNDPFILLVKFCSLDFCNSKLKAKRELACRDSPGQSTRMEACKQWVNILRNKNKTKSKHTLVSGRLNVFLSFFFFQCEFCHRHFSYAKCLDHGMVSKKVPC